MSCGQFVQRLGNLHSQAMEVACKAVVAMSAEPVWKDGDHQWADQNDALP